MIYISLFDGYIISMILSEGLVGFFTTTALCSWPITVEGTRTNDENAAFRLTSRPLAVAVSSEGSPEHGSAILSAKCKLHKHMWYLHI
jgi:hypothetical protein